MTMKPLYRKYRKPTSKPYKPQPEPKRCDNYRLWQTLNKYIDYQRQSRKVAFPLDIALFPYQLNSLTQAQKDHLTALNVQVYVTPWEE